MSGQPRLECRNEQSHQSRNRGQHRPRLGIGKPNPFRLDLIRIDEVLDHGRRFIGLGKGLWRRRVWIVGFGSFHDGLNWQIPSDLTTSRSRFKSIKSSEFTDPLSQMDLCRHAFMEKPTAKAWRTTLLASCGVAFFTFAGILAYQTRGTPSGDEREEIRLIATLYLKPGWIAKKRVWLTRQIDLPDKLRDWILPDGDSSIELASEHFIPIDWINAQKTVAQEN